MQNPSGRWSALPRGTTDSETDVTLYLHDADVSSLLTLPSAVDCVDQAFRLLSDGAATNGTRRRTTIQETSMNLMWAAAPSLDILGIKEYLVARQDVTQGAVLTLLLHSISTGQLLAVVKADRLGQLRTAAASAVATRALARPHSTSLAIFGCGFQAWSQALAMAATLPALDTVHVVGRDPVRRDRFVEVLQRCLPIEVRGADAEYAAESDVVVTATGSSEPVLDGRRVRPGAHVNAVGSNSPTKREVDRHLLERTSLLVVDERETAAQECGDLIANDWDQHNVVTLGDVLTGRAPGRSQAEDITLFESQGLALQDVVCGAAIYRRAVEASTGQMLTIAPEDKVRRRS